MDQVSAARVADRWLRTGSKWSPDQVRNILARMRAELGPLLEDPITKAKVTSLKPRKHEWNSWPDYQFDGTASYYTSVDYPEWVVLRKTITVPFMRILRDAASAEDVRLPGKFANSILVKLMDLVIKVGKEALPTGLSAVDAAMIEDWLYSAKHGEGIDSDSTYTIVDGDGEEDVYPQEVDVRFRYELDGDKSTVAVTLNGDEAAVRFTIPVLVRFVRMVPPHDHDFRGR